MDDVELVFVERWATCLTAGCENYGTSVRILVPEGGDVGCGVCSQPITDVAEGPPEDITEMPTWEL